VKLVAAITPNLRGEMIDFCRLYAYPANPEPPANGGFIILDSGAFGLSQSGQKIGIGWMKQLAEHYKKFNASSDFPVLGMAPDAYLDACTTMNNWMWWQKNINLPVVPVIQFKKKKMLDAYHAVIQAKFYAPSKPPVVAISNPSMRAIEAPVMRQICCIIRQITGAKWLHNLGAGWSPLDVKKWFELGFDSIDSIAYYTDAQNGLRWRTSSDEKELIITENWIKLAVENFRAAIYV
jgi:hypothetical protein